MVTYKCVPIVGMELQKIMPTWYCTQLWDIICRVCSVSKYMTSVKVILTCRYYLLMYNLTNIKNQLYYNTRFLTSMIEAASQKYENMRPATTQGDTRRSICISAYGVRAYTRCGRYFTKNFKIVAMENLFRFIADKHILRIRKRTFLNYLTFSTNFFGLQKYRNVYFRLVHHNSLNLLSVICTKYISINLF